MPFEKYNIKHHNQTERDVKSVTLLFDELISQVAMYVSSIELKRKIFKFKWFPNIRKRVDDLLQKHAKKVETSIENSVKNHWEFSNKKYDKLKGFNPVATRNAEGLQAFRNRKNRKLSKRIWKQTEQLRQELEMAIDTAIKDGTPVNKLATELKEYLKEPDRLYRRYRNNNGQLQLSKNAKAYHPGQGVYRSSYKNAERLARTEINRAYRIADIERMASNPYVRGYEIKRSKHPYPCKTCDLMAGRYPKNFIWGGNHPNCRCYLVPIMASDEDFINEVIPKQITTINPKLTKWIEENSEKIANANSLPYFLSDNEQFWKDKIPNYKILSNSEIKNLIHKGAITNDVFQIKGKYSLERQELHKKIVNDYLNTQKVKSDKVFMLGGAPANGKSSVVDSGALPHPKNILVIDPDKVKGMIPEYKNMLQSGNKTLIKNAANFVHEESSYLGKIIQEKALKNNYGVVFDGVNDGSFEKVSKKVKLYKSLSNKPIRADYVSLDSDLSVKLATIRAEKTGREVPLPYIKKCNKEISVLVPKLIKNKTFDELYLWDTNINGKPRLILKQINGKLDIIDRQLYDDFLNKAKK